MRAAAAVALSAALCGCPDLGGDPMDWDGPDVPVPGDAGGDGDEDAADSGGIPEHAEVLLEHLAIDPPQVRIAAGGTVTWTNLDNVPHDIRSGTPTQPTGEITSALLNRSETYTHSFNEAGTYQYYCSTHENAMSNGIVEVVEP